MTTVEPLATVHPVAALFPMLDDDELVELAEDIKANGLRHPIVVDPDGVLLDGRNRLRACQMVEVEPSFETYDGDSIALILSLNVHRRHLTVGQRAMAAVLANEFSNLKTVRLAESAGTSVGAMHQALYIREHAPELADEIIARTKTLNEAYTDAKQRQAERESRQASAQRAADDMKRLRDKAPDLVELVADARINMREALAALTERERVEREQAERLTKSTVQSLLTLRTVLYREPSDLLSDWIENATPHQTEGPFADEVWTPDGLRMLGAQLVELGDELARRRNGGAT